ncbi:hypothetical protein HMI55_001401 [Coelomomyces lativittatus]|nr:hypothetical protein HMI55_001401 [Coelomomyces lativittatus]
MKSLLLFLPTAPSTPPSHLHFKSTFTSSSLTFPFKNDLKYIHFLPFTFFLPRSFYSNASSSTSNLNTTATTGNKLLTIIEQLNNQPNKWVSLQHLIQTGSLAWSFSSKKNHPPLSSTAFISTLPSTTPPFMHATQNTPPSFSSSTSTATTFTNPLSLSQLLINNAHFLRSELPRRLAKRCKAFQMLPYIVGTNPYIHHVFSLYMQSLQTLLQLPTIESEKEEEHFDVALDQLVKAHLHVIPTLAQGFLESSKYISVSLVNAFLDELIHARIGVRVLGMFFFFSLAQMLL